MLEALSFTGFSLLALGIVIFVFAASATLGILFILRVTNWLRRR